MRIYNSIKNLTKFEWALLLCSMLVITVSYFFSNSGLLSLTASLIGVTALIFIAKGDVLGQVLIIIFSILYAIVSFQNRYYGEMITYLCMSAPAAAAAVVTWLKNPYENGKEVKVSEMTKAKIIFEIILTVTVTAIFYFILKALNTNNLSVSTVSVATSFSASTLLILRSPLYAVGYALNDIVLIVLWTLASIQNIAFLPMVFCFITFLANDIYGFISWNKMKKRQQSCA